MDLEPVLYLFILYLRISRSLLFKAASSLSIRPYVSLETIVCLKDYNKF